MSNIKILNTSDSLEWNDYLSKMPKDLMDVYFKPEYYELFEQRGDGKAQCFVFEKSESIGMYPFLKNSINELGYSMNDKYYDIQGAYGYNGIIVNDYNEQFLDSFFSNFDDYCIKNNIVAEFLRINPLLRSPILNRPRFNLILDRENVFVDLQCDTIFESEFTYATRKNIRKAEKSGLVFNYFIGNAINDFELNQFHSIYSETMDRNNADAFYYFNIEFFKSISNQLISNAIYVLISLDGKYISGELILLGDKIAYSFLGGTLNEFYQFRPNDFLKHNAILLLKKLGFKYFLLGGGPEGVLRFKKSLSKNGVIPFFIGKKIHLKEQYDSVVHQWEVKNTSKVDLLKGILLKYRY
jgi:hypothetical protein